MTKVCRTVSGFQLGAVLGALLLWATMATAQLTTGTISGSVTDPSGAAVPGANITVKNVETGTSRTTVAGATGRYELSNLQVGQYEVSATSAGFQTSVRSGIALTVGRIAVVDHALQVGEVTTTVSVAGEASLVETTTATVSQLVDEKKVEDLPLNNRDLTQLAFLQPGVIKSPGTGGVFSGMGDKITVAGARQTQNLFLLDGVSNTDLSNNPQGASGAYTGAETVKEFQIITNNYSAEYQSAAGAIVSAVTKSGTNTLHGSGFWVLRNDNMDANSWENNRSSLGKREFKRNQFGGSLGGPIIPDRTFFFGSYEGTKRRLADVDKVNTYNAATRAGTLPNGSSVTVNPNIASLLKLWPVPNEPYFITGESYPQLLDFGTGVVQIVGTRTDPINEDFVGAKFDHQLGNEKLGFLSGTYNWTKSDQFPSSVLSQVGAGSGTTSLKHTLGVSHTSVLSPTTINEFKFGYSLSDVVGDIPLTSLDFQKIDIPGSGTINLVSNPARHLIGDMNAPQGGTGIGWRTDFSQFFQKAYQFKDGISLSRGNHSYRMGTEIKLFRYQQVSCSRGCNGVWTWRDDLPRFLTNQPRRLESFVPGHDNPPRHLKQLLFGAYFQDNWQMASSLTLNLGLRYEFTTVPSEENGLVSTLKSIYDPAVTVTQAVKDDPRYKNDTFMPDTIDGFFKNPTLKSFSPRVGFAWAPGSKRFSVRGGAGIFYEYPMLFNIRTSLQESPPFVQTARIETIPSGFPALTWRPGVVGDYQNLFAQQGGVLAARPFDYDQKNVSVYRWSLTLQQEVGAGWVASAGYTGSRGVHLWNQYIANICKWIGWPAQPSGAKQWPTPPSAGCSSVQSNFINPSFGEIRQQSPNGNSFFHGLAVGAQKRLSHGLQVQMAYNLSKSIDDGSGVTSGGENLPQNQRGVYYWDTGMRKGLSQFDIRQTFTANFTYELPTQNLTGAMGAIAGGWQLNGILTRYTGYPLTILDENQASIDYIGDDEYIHANLIPGGNNNPVLGGPTNYYDVSQFAPATPGFFGTVGRNTLSAPGQFTMDFSVQKNFRVTENHRVQFRAEFFNFSNHPNFDSPNTSPFDALGRPNPELLEGQITETRGDPRTIQLGLRYTF